MKVFLVILVVVAILFVGTVLLGVHQGSKSENSDEVSADIRNGKYPLFSKLGGLSGSPALKTSGSGCLSFKNKVLTMNQLGCTMIAEPAKREMLVIPAPKYRSIKFQINSGSVTFETDSLNKKGEVWTNSTQPTPSLVIGDENRNQITLRCSNPGSCQVQFQ